MNKVMDKTFSASVGKDFDRLITAARRRPIAVERGGKKVAYVISRKKMEAIEDTLLGMRAMEIMRKGTFLGVEESEKFLKSLLIKKHARD